MRRLLVLVGLCCGLALVLTGTAFAHASLLRSQPEENALLERSPAEVRLWFTEPVEPQFSEVLVYNRNRTPVTPTKSQVDPTDPTSLALPLPELGEGTYTVAWKALSTVDGHITQGAFAFGVGVQEVAADPVIAGGVASERPAAPAVVAKWLSLLGLAGLVGGLIFAQVIVRPVARRQPPLPGSTLAVAWLHHWRRVLWGSGVLLISGLLISALARGVAVAGGNLGGVVSTLWATRQGWLAIAALLLSLLLIAAATWVTQPHVRRPASKRAAPSDRFAKPSPADTPCLAGVGWWLTLAVAAGLLVVFSLSSHQAVASAFTPLAVAADWLHLVATCAWLGGLVHLLVTWWPAARRLSNHDRLAALASLMPRFSAIGLLAVSVLVVTGSFNGWLQVGTLSGLTDTLYGRSLLLKLLLFLPMLALGAVNLLWVSPRLTAVERTTRKLGRVLPVSQRFRRFVALEVGFGLLVLLLVGVLTNAPPAYQAALAPKPIVAETRAEGLQLSLTITPGQVGQNVFDLSLADAAGRPITIAERVRLQFEMTQMPMGLLTEELESQGNGHYLARGSTLSMGGPWSVQALFRRPGEADTQGTFPIEVKALPINPVLEPPGPGAWPVGWAVGPALLASGLLLAFTARRLVPVGRQLATSSALLGFLAFVGGAYFFTTAVQAGTSGLPQNPFPANEASLARGRQLYDQYCASCHGAEGRGDGPAAAALNPRPVDFTEHATQHPPGQLFVWISQGIRGTAMPPFDPSLSEEDRWHLVNYIRSLTEATEARDRESSSVHPDGR